MGTPREYSYAKNDEAIGLICDYIKLDNSHMEPLEIAQACITSLDEKGLVVVTKDEWKLVLAVKLLLQQTGKMDPADVPYSLQEGMDYRDKSR